MTLQLLDLIRINVGAQWSSSRNKWLVAFSRAEDKEEFSLASLIAYRQAIKDGRWDEPESKNRDLYALCRRIIGLLKTIDQKDFQHYFMKFYVYLEECWSEALSENPATLLTNEFYRDTDLYLRVAKNPKTGEILFIQKRYPFYDAVPKPGLASPSLDFNHLAFKAAHGDQSSFQPSKKAAASKRAP